MKICTKCGVDKDESDFYKRSNGKINPECKVCNLELKKRFRSTHNEEIKTKKKLYYEQNRELIIAKNKKYYEENKEKVSVRKKEYSKKYRESNREYMKEYSKKYNKKNRHSINFKRNEILRNDPCERFKQNLRRRLLQAFKLYSKNGKTKVCSEYGIDFKAIYDKIGQKPEGNYHLDHIIPLSVFDLDNPEHVRLAHLPENLRWLDATENISKNDTIDIQLICEFPDLMLIACEIGLI